MTKYSVNNDHQPNFFNWLWWSSLSLVIAGVSLGQLGRLSSYWGFGFYLHDVGIGLGLLTFFGQVLSQRKKIKWKSLIHSIPLSWRLVVTWLVLSTLMASLKTNSWLPLLYGLRLISYGLVLAKFSQLWSQSTNLKLAGGLVISFTLMGFGLWQYLVWPDMRFLATLAFDDHLYRLIGSWFDPAMTGGLIAVLGLFWLNQAKVRGHQKWSGLAMVLSLASIVVVGLTFSRASYLAVITGLIVFAVTSWRFERAWSNLIRPLVLIVVFSLTVVLASKPTGEGIKLDRASSVMARVHYDQSLTHSLSTKDWWFGQGLFISTGQTQPDSHARLPNNLIVFLLTDLGLVGSLILIYMLFQLAWPTVKTQPLAMAITTCLLIASGFNNVLLHPAFWVVGTWALAQPIKE